jgi:hypothetical protein
MSSTITKKLSINDYYQINDWGPRNKLSDLGIPTYFFDLDVISSDRLSIIFDVNDYFKFCRVLILSPCGRVIKSNNKSDISFNAASPGKYVIKYWIKGIYNTKIDDDLIYQITIHSMSVISVDNSKIRVYSLLGVSREGSLFKGEQLKELCQERYTPQKDSYK